jgi:hypothetical protein
MSMIVTQSGKASARVSGREGQRNRKGGPQPLTLTGVDHEDSSRNRSKSWAPHSSPRYRARDSAKGEAVTGGNVLFDKAGALDFRTGGSFDDPQGRKLGPFSFAPLACAYLGLLVRRGTIRYLWQPPMPAPLHLVKGSLAKFPFLTRRSRNQTGPSIMPEWARRC